jgi:hypothetical protein
MKILLQAAFLVFALLVGIAGAKDKDKNSQLQAKLVGSQEVPVVATVATGEFRGVISPDNQSIDFVLTYSGLQGAQTQQAHIHVGQRSVNGGIVIWFCQSASNPGPVGTPPCTNGSGTFSGTITAANVVAIGGANVGQQISAGEFAKVLAAIRAGNAYANVHTNLSTGGEIRGQIKVVKKFDDNDDDDED